MNMLIAGCSNENLNTIEGEVPAPDNRHRAVLFQRSWGAVGGVTENISIVKTGDQLENAAGNVYCESADYDGSKPKLWLNWRGNKILQIFCDAKAHTYSKEKHYTFSADGWNSREELEIEYGDYDSIQPAKTAKSTTPKKHHR